jgi:fatty acid desaturase
VILVVAGFPSKTFILQGFSSFPQAPVTTRRKGPRIVASVAHAIPSPSALTHLRPTDRHGFGLTGLAVGSTTVALWLSVGGGWVSWIVGQVVLAASLVQWFAILHECGHRTLFRARRLNAAIGLLAGFVTMIPYWSWVRVHGRHHKWTGWQDLDPTTESLVPRHLTTFERWTVNICWRLWIPLFSVTYRVQNYWNLRRLAALFPHRQDVTAMRVNVLAQVAAYGGLLILAGPLPLLQAIGAGVVLSLIAEDLLLLSQHTHVPLHVSEGKPVPPVPAVDQEVFTRSLRLPRWASAFLLHFDAHELHHMYPFVPGYHLREIPYQPANEVGWWQWVRSSKRLQGVVLLFHNRDTTGFPL